MGESDPNMVPTHLQVYGPHNQAAQQSNVLYSLNPFANFLGRQQDFTPANRFSHQPQNFYQAVPRFPQPQFLSSQSEFLNHPPKFGAQFSNNYMQQQRPQFVSTGEQPLLFVPQEAQRYFAADPQYTNNLRTQVPLEEDSLLDKGHVQFHPKREQVQTYTAFKTSLDDASAGLMSRAAVESRPLQADMYSSIRDNVDDSDTPFSRASVEAYPANLMSYNSRNSQDDSDYGAAGFRQAVESRPDISEPEPQFRAQPNVRPYGHVSKHALATVYKSPATQLFYSRGGGSIRQIDPKYKVICYYESWANFRPSPQDFSIDRIDPHACTHLMYAFAGLEESNNTIKSLIPEYDVVAGGYKSIVSLKGKNPDLKVIIAVGGWNEGGKKYSNMVTTDTSRKMFVDSVVKFLEENHFDGLDINWEYPGASDRGGRATDKENFAKLVMELKEAFKPHGWSLSAAVSPARFRIDEGYDVKSLSTYLDFINVITYDLRGPWDGKADHNAPIAERLVDTYAYKNLNVKDGMAYWVELGADQNKLIMGIPFYGRSYTLENATNHEPGARIRHAGKEGPYTKEQGFLAYYEVCGLIREGGWEQRTDENGGPYIVKGDQWISYDSPQYIDQKMILLRHQGYGGAMVWAVDLDDQLGVCAERWPLLSAVRKGLGDREDMPPPPQPQPQPSPEPEPSSVSSPAESGEETAPEPNTTRETTTTMQSTLSDATRETECTPNQKKADPQDCSYFLVCDNGVFIRFHCGAGLAFDEKNGICDHAHNVDCKTGSPPETVPSISEPSPPPSGGVPSPPPTVEKPNIIHPSVALETAPTTGKLSVKKYMVVCYFTNWAWYRSGNGKYTPDDIDASLCTHVVYGFAVLDSNRLVIKPHDTWADFDNKFYQRVTDLKKKGVKVSIAIGGWNDSLGSKYSRLVLDPNRRRAFNEHVVNFVLEHNFDGLDLDWEYPVCWQVDCKKGSAEEKQAFADWVRELNEAFKPHDLLLSAAVSPNKKVIDLGYDIPVLNKYLDWIAVMTYDYHGHWDKKTGHVAPYSLHPEAPVDYFNMDYTIRYWLDNGATRDKLVLGMPLYGQSFTVNDPSTGMGLNAPASKGTAGQFTKAAGFLAYYEICRNIREKGWQVVKDPTGAIGPYAYKGNQWASFDDVDMIRKKSQYIKDMGLAGGMVWALDLDDFRNVCQQGHHPLLSTIRSVLGTDRSPPVDMSNMPTKGVSTPAKPDIVPPRVSGSTQPDSSNSVSPGTDVAQPGTDEYKVVCYFTNWAWYRPGEGKYKPSDIDYTLCSHIIYGFAVLDGSRLTIKPHDRWADFDNNFYKNVTALRKHGIKVLIAIGGWNDSAGDKYSKLVNDPTSRSRFVTHIVEFIKQHNFDGLDLDWEYPVCWQVDCDKGPASDKEGFSAWVKELYDAFQPHGYLLSAAVSPSNKVIEKGYDVPVLSRYLDWIAVMTYDYHGQWDKKTGHVAPMYRHPEDENIYFNTNYTIDYWLKKGADPKKLVMGMPMYGQSFTLSQSTDNRLNKKTYGGGEAGQYTRARGFLAYYEICYKITKSTGWTVERDPLGTMGPFAYKGNQWVGFDDIDAIRYKSEYIKTRGLGGGMIWALDLDDFRNRCGCEPHPLLRTINRVLRNYHIPDPGCPVLGGGPPTSYMPYGYEDYEQIPTTTTTTTVPSWMTWSTPKRPVKTTTPAPWTPPTSTTRAPWLPSSTTRAPWLPTSTTRAPWLPSSTTRAPWLPSSTTRAPWLPSSTTRAPWLPAGSSISVPWQQVTVKQDKCEVGSFMNHESDCNKFYQCIRGQFEERKCMPGMQWTGKRCARDTTCQLSGSSPITTKSPQESQSPKTTRAPWLPSTTTRAPWQPPTTTLTTTTPTTTLAPWQPPTTTLPPSSDYKVVCYFTNWAWYRPSDGKYMPEDIDPSLCSHIVYGFAVLDYSNLVIKPHDSWADIDSAFYSKVTSLKKLGIKILIAIGGWNDSQGNKYSRLVNDPTARAKFTNHVLEFIIGHNFDGLDLDWEYPVCWQVNCDKGPASDKEGFSAWVRELYDAFQPHELLLSAAVSPNYKVIDKGYEVPIMDRYLDWIAVMTYDYHGHWDKQTGHVAPMYHHPESTAHQFNANYTINYWLEKGASRQKLVMGIPMYGQAFTLMDASDNGLNSVATKGKAGQFTRAAGFLAYYEICNDIRNNGYTVVKDPTGAMGPYAYKDNQWVGYDDVSMVRYKSQYVKNMGLGGAMIWALDLDDFRNTCGCEPHPLLRTINRELRGYSAADPNCNI